MVPQWRKFWWQDANFCSLRQKTFISSRRHHRFPAVVPDWKATSQTSEACRTVLASPSGPMAGYLFLEPYDFSNASILLVSQFPPFHSRFFPSRNVCNCTGDHGGGELVSAGSVSKRKIITRASIFSWNFTTKRDDRENKT